MEQKRLEQYAKLAVEMGANVQKGQTLILNTSIEAIDFTRACVKAAYEAGAKEVIVNYEDERIAAMHYTYQSEETLSHVRNWQVESKLFEGRRLSAEDPLWDPGRHERCRSCEKRKGDAGERSGHEGSQCLYQQK